tara:strand:- start:645 stop:821 length:177 start_codon:yes stop_codon:yes gene_type:complete
MWGWLSRKINEFLGRQAESSERSQKKDIRLGQAQIKKMDQHFCQPVLLKVNELPTEWH